MYNTHQLDISLERLEYLRKIKLKKYCIFIAQLLILILFFTSWELCAQLKIIDSFITSQPSRIIATLVNLYNEGELLKHISITCLETIIGFLLGTILGTIIASLLWWSEFLSKVFEPYLVILNSLPKIALGPIFIVWFGAGPTAIIIITLAISLIVTILEVLNGFLTVDEDKVKLIQTFGGTRMQIFTKVVLPSNIPIIINALKINVGLSWVGVIVGEFLVSRAGLGYLIVYGGQVFKLDLVMTSVFILSIAAGLMYKGITIFEKFIIKNYLQKTN